MPLAKPRPWNPPRPLPEHFDTPRLRLRFFTPDDAPALFDAVDSSRDTLVPWMPWAASDHRSVQETVHNIVQFERWVRERNLAMGYVVGVFARDSGRLLGGTGLNRFVAEAHQAETGYWVRTDARRRGVASEAVAAMITWAFRPPARGGWGLRRIVVYAAAHNTASRAVPAKLGLPPEGVLRQDRWIDGLGWDDTHAWGVQATDWDEVHQRPVVP